MQNCHVDAGGEKRLRQRWGQTHSAGHVLAVGPVAPGSKANADLIIVNGRNYYPQDLEWEANKVEGVRKVYGTRVVHEVPDQDTMGGAFLKTNSKHMAVVAQGGAELQSEYLLPRAAALDAVDRLVEAERFGEAIEASLAATTSMTADFMQTDGKGRQMAGTLSLKRPGKIRFAYGGGVNMLLVANGKTLNFIDYDVGQKSSWPIAKSPLAVLLSAKPDLGRIADVLDRGADVAVGQDAHRPDLPALPDFSA